MDGLPFQLWAAVVHEAGHAWMVLTVAGRSVDVIIPAPDTGEDPRCEWDARGVPPAVGVCTTLGGLAAELMCGVPPDLAWRNASDDLDTLSLLVPAGRIGAALDLVRGMLERDEDGFRSFLDTLLEGMTCDRLPFRRTFSPNDLPPLTRF